MHWLTACTNVAGLSYSQFSYSNLAATKESVSVTVTNTGKKAGAEVAQLYLTVDGAGSALPPVPFALAGFEKVMLAPGASTKVNFQIGSEKSLTVVGVDGSRHPATGTVSVSVGGHLPSDPRAKLLANAKHASNIVTGSFVM